jgi:choline-sulfatase
VRAPHLDRLAADGVVFDAAYTNSPICVAARAALMTGRFISSTGLYDNGTEFPASLPTFVHHLRRAGYQTALSGKMHFIGPDQLHGFEERLTTDIYPAGFDWTPNWRRGPVHNSGASVREVPASGVCHWSTQLDYDEETHFRAVGHLYELARRRQRDSASGPWFMCVSYTHPHDPFTITPEYWDRYTDDEIDVPPPAPPLESLHPYDQWLQIHHEVDLYAEQLTEEVRRAARRAYYGMVSYVDDKVGDLRHHLRRAGFERDTLILFTSDHGEMLGERGMWFKRTFYQWSARIPFIAAWPGTLPGGRREAGAVSLVDLFPTFTELAEAEAQATYPSHQDGHSLVGLLEGSDGARERWPDRAISEYLGEGVITPCRMLRRGEHKYVYVHGEAPQLYDVAEDPGERHNLAGVPEHAETEGRLRAELLDGWDPEAVNQAVLDSQQTRHFLRDALATGRREHWDYQAGRVDGPFDDTRRYVRERNVQVTAADERVPPWPEPAAPKSV